MANYTMTYKNYVERYGDLTGLGALPSVTIGGINYSFAAMFTNRHKYHEIGAETPELFTELANRYLNELGLIYHKKIKDWETHLDDIWEREVTVTDTTTDTYYLNPTVSTTEGNPKIQSISEHSYPHRIVYNTKDAAALLNASVDIENLFYEALKQTDVLFMSLY